MGKSPGRWIKAVLFGKKLSKSNLSKDATIDKKTSIARKSPLKDFDDHSLVISSPVPMHAGGECTALEKTASINLTSDTIEVARSNLRLNTANEDEFIRLEHAAIMTQAAFRGYMARRAFWVLKSIRKLQAHIRGHLVRRQAVATLSCMRAIVEFQALTRGQIVRLSTDNRHVLQKCTPGELVGKKRTDLLEKSLRLEKLSTNAFGTKLVSSSHTTMPLSIQYDPVEPNSARNWLERWSASRFWEPFPRTKTVPNTKPTSKQIKLQHEETETQRPKRNAHRVAAPNIEGKLVISSENKKPKATSRKVCSQQTETVKVQSHSELEKVKLSLRKLSISTAGPSEKPEIITEKQEVSLGKASGFPNPSASDRGTDQPVEKVNDLNEVMATLAQPEPFPVPSLEENKVKPHNVLQDSYHPADTDLSEISGKECNSSKGNQKTRRKSFPAKEEHHPERMLHNSLTLPSYMAATESAKAKFRSQSVGGAENGFARRHSLPSYTQKVSMQSPRVQKSLLSWTKSNKSQISPRDYKMLQTGWKR